MQLISLEILPVPSTSSLVFNMALLMMPAFALSNPCVLSVVAPGGAIACALLGTTGIGGLACAGILGLIAMFGCHGAKERVCGGARR